MVAELGESLGAAMRALILISVLLGLSSATQASETLTYTYDALGRLTKVARSGAVNNAATECYAYDPANNRTNVTALTSSDCAAGAGVSFSISGNGPVTEGQPSVFTVTRTGTPTGTLTVNYATASGSATSGSDFTATSGTLTFLTTDTSKTVSVPTIDDAVVESAETFTMTLSAPSGGATLGTATATATINDNDSPPNHPPTAVNDTGSMAKCATKQFNVTANDSDPDGDALTVISVTNPTYFSVFSASQVQVDSPTTAGTLVGTYTVQDTHGATATATLTVTVSGGVCQ